jgi:VWFA-related protein
VKRISIAVFLIVTLAVPAGVAQQQAPQRSGPVSDTVRAVLVDVVVRDRKGEQVRDLTQADFEIIEDGVTQKIGSFSGVFDSRAAVAAPSAASATRPPSDAPPPAPAGAPPAAANVPAITALVFDRLTPEAQSLAVKAAQGYLGTKEETANYIGIFGVDLALTPYAPFTRNAQQLRQALSKVATRGSSSGSGNPERQQQRANLTQQAAAASQTVANAAAAGGPGASGAMGTAPAAAQLAQMQAQMISDFDAMERDQEGYGTTNGLFAVINVLGRQPGRKSLVLFSEGLSIPPAVQRLFLGVIDAANRANVSIYSMDAAGLRALSDEAKIRDTVNQAAEFGINTAYTGGQSGDPLTKALEANEGVLRQNPAIGLGQLATETGGVLFQNTNNLRQGFERVEEDSRNYYLLGYTPTNDVYDGRFRRIDVKVNRPGVVVASRRGYFALRDPGGVAVNVWEAPALGALEQKPLPNAFPVRAGTLLFPEPGRPGLVPVIVEFKTTAITFQPSADGKTYTSDFAVIARFVDQKNEVVRKVSQHYEVNGPIAQMESAGRGDVLFYREPELAPGVYTMETVVHDALSGKSSIRIATVEVPPADPQKLRMSSLVLVKRGEKLNAKERRADNPLSVGDVLVYPNLGDPISRSSKEVGFFFTTYPVKGGAAVEGMLELLQNGQRVAQIPMPLASPDASGRVQQLGRLPVDQLPPGTYELKAVVKQGSEQMSRSVVVRLVE